MGRLLRRPPLAAAVAVALAAALLTPAVHADYDDLGSFTPDLRDASLYLADHFREGDVLATTTGQNEPGVDSRLYGGYVVLVADSGSPLASWRPLVNDERCLLSRRLQGVLRRPGVGREWMLLRPPDPAATAAALGSIPRLHAQIFGSFVLAAVTPPHQTATSAMRTAITVWKAAARSAPAVWDFRAATHTYRIALDLVEQGVCAKL